MAWIIIAIVSYLLNAVVTVIDKSLVSNKVRDPLVYSFYVGILSSVVFVLWPFDFSFLPINTALAALICGVAFFLALYFYYASFLKTSATRTVTVIGGISPIILLVLSYFFLDERLPSLWYLAFLLLLGGSFLITFGKNITFTYHSFVSAVFFALSFFTIKIVFLNTTFINGLVWTRIGFLAIAVFLLCFNSFRKKLFASPLKVTNKLFALFVGNKAMSALSGVLLNYAILLGSVSVINALQGVKYVGVFVIASFLSICCPGFIKESLEKKMIAQKVFGVAMVCLGIVLLFI